MSAPADTNTSISCGNSLARGAVGTVPGSSRRRRTTLRMSFIDRRPCCSARSRDAIAASGSDRTASLAAVVCSIDAEETVRAQADCDAVKARTLSTVAVARSATLAS
jgi:hypothetical protein